MGLCVTFQIKAFSAEISRVSRGLAHTIPQGGGEWQGFNEAALQDQRIHS